MMKDECGGKQILKFMGLRARMYSYRMNEEEEKRQRVLTRM